MKWILPRKIYPQAFGKILNVHHFLKAAKCNLFSKRLDNLANPLTPNRE